MRIVERHVEIDWNGELTVFGSLHYDGDPIRLVVDGAKNNRFNCSVGVIQSDRIGNRKSLFSFSERLLAHDDKFRVALMIPTGLGASVGGHAGDAGPTARLLASVCDTLITHPNVVNASDINEMTDNTLYVEGYALTEYLLGRIGLQRVKQNRVLVVVDGSANSRYIDAAINSVNAAVASYGL
ncbi:hypothetical protein LCGC14_1725670, partial [marine sediment metagenome]